MSELICPECHKKMELYEQRDSLLKLGIIYTYGCEYCGGVFEVKRDKGEKCLN